MTVQQNNAETTANLAGNAGLYDVNESDVEQLLKLTTHRKQQITNNCRESCQEWIGVLKDNF